MAEKTKWDVIAERKRRKKEDAAIRAGGGLDQSWQRFTYCRICGKKFCVNNFPDHKPRIKRFKVKGVIMCPWCKGHGGEFIAAMYNLVQDLAGQLQDRALDSDFAAEAEVVLVESPLWKRERALHAKAMKEINS